MTIIMYLCTSHRKQMSAHADGCNFGTTAYLDLNSTTNVFNSRSFDQQKVNSCRFVFIFTF